MLVIKNLIREILTIGRKLVANPWEMNWKTPKAKVPEKAPADGPWNMNWKETKKASKESPVDVVYKSLAKSEGSGDKVTGIKTGNLGVTKWARQAVNAKDGTTDEEVAKLYLGALNKMWESKEGYSDAPIELQAALLDSAYNMGASIMKHKSVVEGLSSKDYSKIGKYILSTSNVGGKSMKGLALRRAEMYNRFSETKVASVEQGDDGTLRYNDKDGNEVFSYKPKGGRHDKSSPGTLFLD